MYVIKDFDILFNSNLYPGYFIGPRWAPQPVNGKEQWIFEAIGSGTTIIKMDLIDTTDKLDTVSIEIEVKVI